MVLKVLIVDDEAPVREMFEELLKKENYRISSVATGEEALEIVKKEDFDVILLDIKLPGISGIETLKMIKDLKPGLIVVMITGFGYDDELIRKSKEYGCAGYIGKNMPITQIISNFKLYIKNAKESTK